MMFRKSFILVSFLLFVIAFSSCEYKWIEGADPSATVSFSSDIQPIFTSKCVSCHSDGGIAPFSLEAGKSYESIDSEGLIDTANPGNSKLLSSHVTEKITANQAEQLLYWIQQGGANDN